MLLTLAKLKEQFLNKEQIYHEALKVAFTEKQIEYEGIKDLRLDLKARI